MSALDGLPKGRRIIYRGEHVTDPDAYFQFQDLKAGTLHRSLKFLPREWSNCGKLVIVQIELPELPWEIST